MMLCNDRDMFPLRTRIAPSPTGRMHAGNIFAALVAWLVARQVGGEVLLRIEDLDRERSRQDYIDHLFRDLEWLGLGWDGEVVYQSQRDDLYLQAYQLLEDAGLTYPCFCTRADLHTAGAPQQGAAPGVYPGTCRKLSDVERAERALDRTPAARLMVPDAKEPDSVVHFHDALQGQVTCELAVACGDYIIRRSDGLFAYQLAVVVDDLLQGVNCLVRGCDLLESTPQQLFLRALLLKLGFAGDGDGATAPTADELAEQMAFYHVPLIVDELGRRLSKRNHDAGIDEMQQRFATPERLLGHIVHITGLVPGFEDGAIDLPELLERFDLDALKLRWALLWE